MQVAWAAAPRAHRELLREMRFRARRKGGCLFVPHMDPLNLFLSAKRVRDPVEGIARKSVDSLDARCSKSIHHQVGYFLIRHGTAPFLYFDFCTSPAGSSGDWYPDDGEKRQRWPSTLFLNLDGKRERCGPNFRYQTRGISVREEAYRQVRSSSNAAWRQRQDGRVRESSFLLTLRRSLFFCFSASRPVTGTELAVLCRVLDTNCFDSWTVSASLAFTRRVISRLSPVSGMIEPFPEAGGRTALQSKSADRDRHPVSASARMFLIN